MKKSLSLKRESLAALTGDELGFVGGIRDIIRTHASCDTCGTLDFSLRECQTLPVYDCLSLDAGCSALCTG